VDCRKFVLTFYIICHQTKTRVHSSLHSVKSAMIFVRWVPLRLCCQQDLTATLYSKITSTKSPSFCMATFSASLSSRTLLAPQSRDYSCYVSRPIMVPLWQQKHTDLHAHDSTQSPYLWRQPRLANLTCFWRWRLCGINTAIVPNVK
jgi:hypothetical protein